MKNRLLLLLTFLMLSFSYSSFAVVGVKAPEATTSVDKEAAEKVKAEWDNLSRKEKRAKKRQLKKELKSQLKAAKKAGTSSDTVLLAIIAIFIPPLAMGLYDGISSRFWISLLLTILFFIPGLIYTLVVILNGN